MATSRTARRSCAGSAPPWCTRAPARRARLSSASATRRPPPRVHAALGSVRGGFVPVDRAPGGQPPPVLWETRLDSSRRGLQHRRQMDAAIRAPSAVPRLQRGGLRGKGRGVRRRAAEQPHPQHGGRRCRQWRPRGRVTIAFSRCSGCGRAPPARMPTRRLVPRGPVARPGRAGLDRARDQRRHRSRPWHSAPMACSWPSALSPTPCLQHQPDDSADHDGAQETRPQIPPLFGATADEGSVNALASDTASCIHSVIDNAQDERRAPTRMQLLQQAQASLAAGGRAGLGTFRVYDAARPPKASAGWTAAADGLPVLPR